MIIELNQKLLELHYKVPLFGVVLFTEQHPFVTKCIHDSDYFAALDSLSGDHMAVFAAGLHPGSMGVSSDEAGFGCNDVFDLA